MRILAMEIPVEHADAGAFQPLLAAEARRVWELQQADVIREAHFRADRSDAVLVLECGWFDFI